MPWVAPLTTALADALFRTCGQVGKVPAIRADAAALRQGGDDDPLRVVDLI